MNNLRRKTNLSGFVDARKQVNHMAVLMNYTIQCRDAISGATGCFIFDLGRYELDGKFYAITPVYADLIELYRHTRPEDRKACYVEHN
jgi:hypothetical protein